MKYLTSFVHRSDGNVAVMAVLAMIPLVISAGFAIDYGAASNNKSLMQNALDAATLSIATLPKDTPLSERQARLQHSYLGNGGLGTATLDSFTVGAKGALSAQASARYDMPTTFMQLARMNQVSIGVIAAVNKKPSLVEAKFEIVGASGYWNKVMTLYGTQAGETTPKKLMQITYTYDGKGDAGKYGGDGKGYGTMTSYVVSYDKNGAETLTPVQHQTCTKNKNNCVTTNEPGHNGAEVDVSAMDTIYLEMSVPSGSPSLLRSNDPRTSDRLYIDGTEVAAGTTVDIFKSVPCGASSQQGWEDGGNSVPAPVSKADFFYKVSGKCDYAERAGGIRLTQ